jgi:hypothetical protein
MRRADVVAAVLLVSVAVALWLPRKAGPIDLRWDGGVYYILGTSLAEGHGYRLLSEPGQIRAVQYPPLLPAIVAVHQRLLGTTDPTTVGMSLRRTSFVVFVAFALVLLWFFRTYLPVSEAVLGAVVSLLAMQAWFLSDALYPELWFGIATLLFLIFLRKMGAARTATYMFALASYALRTVGVAAFVVWVADSVIRRRFREAALRAVLALIPIAAWQGYVTTVEHSDAYAHPAYEYQRAPYMFYNVSYARNLTLRDPSDPAKGGVRIFRRAVRGALELPANLGEVLTSPRVYLNMGLHTFGVGRAADGIIAAALFAALWVLGLLLVGGGVVLLLARGQWQAPLYLLVYLAALSITPWLDQNLRYLMPVSGLPVLSAIVFLRTRGTRTTFLVFGAMLLVQVAVAVRVFTHDYDSVTYRDACDVPVAYNLFFYRPAERGFDEAIDYLRAHAHPPQIVAAGTPHWIYLRTGLQSVMPPFERDPVKAQHLLESVPVEFLVVGDDVIKSERFTGPAVRMFPDKWTPVYSTAVGGWTVYRRVVHPPRDL